MAGLSTALHCGSAHDVHIQEKNGLTCNNAALLFFFFFLRRSKLNFPYILTTQPKCRGGRQPRALDMRAFLTGWERCGIFIERERLFDVTI